MKKIFLIAASLIAIVPAGWCDYVEKPDTNTNYVAEPILAPGTPAAEHPDGAYPYYGCVPDEMLPYRNIKPFYQYWLTRLP